MASLAPPPSERSPPVGLLRWPGPHFEQSPVESPKPTVQSVASWTEPRRRRRQLFRRQLFRRQLFRQLFRRRRQLFRRRRRRQLFRRRRRRRQLFRRLTTVVDAPR
jgi:hypothetical protein